MIAALMFRFLPKVLHVVVPVVALLLFSACATTAPVQEMSNARQSIQAAVDVGAEKYAPDSLAEARQLLLDASDALDSGDYALARQNALAAKEFALKAHQAALSKNTKKTKLND